MGESPSSPPRWEWDPSVDMMKRPLWNYNPDAEIYRCPSDHSVDPVGGSIKPRILTKVMNLYVGGFAPQSGIDPLPNGTDGHWQFADPFRIFSKVTDLTSPGPANTFLFIDARPEAINWANFMTVMTGYPNNPTQYQFNGDYPGIYHSFGAGISFADGRSEVHRWLDPRTAPLPLSVSFLASPNNADVAWLQAHSTSLK
jgi:hypothetical protein